MGLLGLSLSISSLMLAPLLVGLGLESGVNFVRSYQRFGTAPNPSSDAFRVTVMLCGLTTLIGFGSLLSAKHVLRDAGISTSLGYSMRWSAPSGSCPLHSAPSLRCLEPPLRLCEPGQRNTPGRCSGDSDTLSLFRVCSPDSRSCSIPCSLASRVL
jgi:hypothetical protein